MVGGIRPEQEYPVREGPNHLVTDELASGRSFHQLYVEPVYSAPTARILMLGDVRPFLVVKQVQVKSVVEEKGE